MDGNIPVDKIDSDNKRVQNGNEGTEAQTSNEKETVLMEKVSGREGTHREQVPSVGCFQGKMLPIIYSSKLLQFPLTCPVQEKK